MSLSVRLALLAAVAMILASCGYSPTPVPVPPVASASSSTSAAGTPVECSNALQSYAPDATVAAGSSMSAIQARGRLIAGVSADTYLLASRNPFTGEVEGFDIDIVKAIAKALLGDENAYQLRVITAAERIPLLQSHDVDVVVRAFTINCSRWQDIAFSAEYYRAGQKVLVSRESTVTGIDQLDGLRVCAPKGTSSMDNLIRLAPGATAVGATNHTGCLVLFQRGEVDAITGDDTVLAGLAAQDPYAKVVGKAFTAEPYGVGVSADHADLAAYVNSVLAQMGRDGSWQKSYNQWLEPTLGKATMPTPQYGRAR